MSGWAHGRESRHDSSEEARAALLAPCILAAEVSVRFVRIVPLFAVLVLGLFLGRVASADDTIRNPGDHPHYLVEIEPRFLFGWDNDFDGNAGVGVGARVSIPIVRNGFVPTINNSVAISFGLDWLHYSDCYFYYASAGYGCGANYFEFPIAMQWNFYVAKRWSVFGEPGFYIYHGVYDRVACNGPNLPPCHYPTETGIDFAGWLGARFHITDKIALTMRIGYPTLSVGVSFMP
jgi:hypothetical protein